MAITFERIIQQSLNRLGAVAGADASTAETNYDATPSTSTVNGPDFTPHQINDALAATLSELVEAIASTPLHPERQRYADVTASLTNRADIPRAGQSGAVIIGVPRFVRDASDSKACINVDLDRVRSYTHFTTIYSALDAYLYCINDGRIEHTRTNVVMGVCVWTRPTVFTGDINCDELHEGGLVAGTVAKLAPKESLFAELRADMKKDWDDHLVGVRAYRDPEMYGRSQGASSST